MGTPLWALKSLLDRAIELDRAEKGNIQLLERQAGVLRIVVQRGFKKDFLRHFGEVRRFDSSACGRAIGAGLVVTLSDVLADPAFEPHRAVAASNGFRSVKSMPIPGPDGEMLGVLSTHSPEVRWDLDRKSTLHLRAEVAVHLAALCRLESAGEAGLKF